MIGLFKSLRTYSRIFNSSKRTFSSRIIYSEEVIAAKKNGEPIVALETTIVTHGMPYPDNYETAIRVENIIRNKGAVPATIGIINGQIHVGLTEEQLKKLAIEAAGPGGAVKCSQRDICTIMAGKQNGGTTVGGTITIANIAGISVMATGGIGGVHRGAQDTFDISSDLVVLSKTPVAVVCAGVKAILDIPKTLEFLETLGVPVVTIGETELFPSFYSRCTSDYTKSPARISSHVEAAECIKAQRDMGINSGLVFAIPIPEPDALDPMEIEGYIEMALGESVERKIQGKNVTPYLLKRITELTNGKSLAANKVLIENNAAASAEISLHLAKLQNKNSERHHNDIKSGGENLGSLVVIGGAVEDTVLQCEEPEMRFDGRTHRGNSRRSFGGVGRNLAGALVELGIKNTKFISVVGSDEAGWSIVKSLGTTGSTIRILEDAITARYSGLLDNTGECRFGLGEMDIFNRIDISLVQEHRSSLENAQLIVLDGNPPANTIGEVIDVAINCQIPVWYEPTDPKKACKIFDSHPRWSDVLHCVSPNVKELFTIAKYFSITDIDYIPPETEVELITEVAEKLGNIIPVVLTTLGAQGLLVTRGAAKTDSFYSRNDSGKLSLINNGNISSRLYPPFSKINENSSTKYSVSGCGDCLVAGVISGLLRGLDEASCITIGLKAAGLSLKSLETVPKTLQTLRNFSPL